MYIIMFAKIWSAKQAISLVCMGCPVVYLMASDVNLQGQWWEKVPLTV